MMNFKKFISFALTLCLTLSSASVFASSAEKSPEYVKSDDAPTYLCFGDSYTRGMGCSDTWEQDTYPDYSDADGTHQTRNVKGAYPYIVATTIGCDTETANGYLEEPDATYWPVIQDGQQVSGLLDILGIEDNFYDSEFYHRYGIGHYWRYERLVEYFGNPDSAHGIDGSKYGAYGSVYDLRDLIEKADLITVALGMSDVLNRSVYAAKHEILDDRDLDECSTDEILEFVAKVLENSDKGYEYFKEAYPLLLEYIVEHNDGGQIIIIGAANPAFGLDVSDEFAVPIFNFISATTAKMNAYYKKWAAEYGVTFIDISNVDTGITENDWTVSDLFDGNALEGSHPSAEGHAYIARQVLKAYYDEQEENGYTLKLDVGRLSRIDSVTIDGIPVKNYTFDKTKKLLTVNCYSPYAKIITVKARGDDGKVASTTYQLAWHGTYKAYRISTTNNYISPITSIANKFSSLFK